MATTPSVEVPVEPKFTIPFHEGELFRIEMDRVTIIDSMGVRARDCDVLVDGVRILGGQAAVVLDRETDRSYEGGLPTHPQRIIAVIVKAKTDSDAAARLAPLVAEDETTRHAVALVVQHPQDGSEVRRWEISDARLLVRLSQGKWTWLEFSGDAT